MIDYKNAMFAGQEICSGRYHLAWLAVALACLGGVPAAAQDGDRAPVIAVDGSIGVVSDYRFRGVSQSDGDVSALGGVTARHGGAYLGVWAARVAGFGRAGGAEMALDLRGGVELPLGNGVVDVGATWYLHPGGTATADFIEPFVRLRGTLGPVFLLGGVAWAPPQRALGNWAGTAESRAGDRGDNLYLWGDGAVAVIGTPVTVRLHVGRSWGSDGVGPNGYALAPTGGYWDWRVGADYVVGPVTLGLDYVDTDIGDAVLPGFRGRDLAGGRLLASVTIPF